MKYIKDTKRLLEIIEILKIHEIDVKEYYHAFLAPQLNQIHDTEDKLIALFAIANSQRQGRNKEGSGVTSATAGFYQGIDQNIRQSMSIATPKDAHLTFLSWLCNIAGVDQKTANLFLKWVVMFQHDFQICSMDWHSWEYQLHVPLDLWVVRLMSKKYLNFCSEDYEQDFLKGENAPRRTSLNLTKEEYKLLQQELGEAVVESNKPRIILDNLWFVGVYFCSYHPIMCDSCWVRKECCNYAHQPDWGSMVTKTKENVKRERREKEKKTREWMRQHLKEVEVIKDKHGF